MRIAAFLLGLALGVPTLACADDDWLAGEYDVAVPDRPAPTRYRLVIERHADGLYHADAFRRSGPDGSVLTPVDPPRDPRLADVRELSSADIDAMKEPRLVRARVRCAIVVGMLLCLVPEGQRLELDDESVGPGYFAAAMEVGSIEIAKRPRR